MSAAAAATAAPSTYYYSAVFVIRGRIYDVLIVASMYYIVLFQACVERDPKIL
jgi:hypothetical protein